MINLLSTYSLTEIIIFLVLVVLAIKELFTLIDWVKDRLKKHFSKEDNSTSLFHKLEEKDQQQDNQIEQIIELQKQMQKDTETILQKIETLMESDKDAIKAFITKEHHYFCYEQGWIDDYNLDCLEKRFKHYKEENGNSFVESLMEEIRALPRQPQNVTN